MAEMRLNQFLARCGVASRRGSEKLILAGRVSVNGKPVSDLSTKVDSERDAVTVDDAKVTLPRTAVVLMLNKPTGVISSMGDPYGRPSVKDFLPLDTYPSLFPIGRLDEDTTGLLLFTTDGELGNALLHPRFEIAKTYAVTIEGRMTDRDIAQLEEGILLDDGKTAPATVQHVEVMRNTTSFELTIHEGKNREVRRMCEALSKPVIALTRLSFAGIELGDLPSGHIRELSTSEKQKLYQTAHMRAAES